MNRHVYKLTASSLAMSLAVVGCTPSVQSQRPMALSAAYSPQLEKDSARLYAQAQKAVQAGNMAEALTLAERTVESSPRDVGYRMLLGDLYLKNGRFASAETSFSDVVTLDPGNVRATLSLALAMIAQGRNLMAVAELEKLEGNAAPGDLGLAFALAGQNDRAIAMLEPAAREQDAPARVRQNLALAYALSGDWQKARITASQDLSAAELPARLELWASLAKPADSYAQVAALLGVTRPRMPASRCGWRWRRSRPPLSCSPKPSRRKCRRCRLSPVEVAAAVPVAPAPPIAAPIVETRVASAAPCVQCRRGRPSAGARVGAGRDCRRTGSAAADHRNPGQLGRTARPVRRRDRAVGHPRSGSVEKGDGG
jgi:Flp pilus assembly protein TadD